MHTRKISESLYIIDLRPAGLERFIASYVLKGEESTAIVETGPTCSIPNLLNGLKEIGIENEEIAYVAVTHIHIDHAGGAGTLMKHLPNAKLIVHPKGAPHIVNPDRLWEASKEVLGRIAIIYERIESVLGNRILASADGEIVDLGGGVNLKILETLGHASHHLAFLENVNMGVFQGDAAGIYLPQLDVTVPTTPAPFNYELTLASLEKLVQIAPARLYYTHFGQVENAVERIKRYEGQLKLWAGIVSEAVKSAYSAQEIYRQILTRDPQMKISNDFIKNHLVLREGVVMQNIQGYVEYFKKLLA